MDDDALLIKNDTDGDRSFRFSDFENNDDDNVDDGAPSPVASTAGGELTLER